MSSSSSSDNDKDDDAFGSSDEEFLDDPYFEACYKDGWLKQKQPSSAKSKGVLAKKWKKRWFRPFNQFFISSAVKDGDDNVAKRIDLREVNTVKPGAKEGDFNIEISGHEPIVLRADSASAAKKWIKALKERIALCDDKTDFLAAKDDEMEEYIRKAKNKKKNKSGGGGGGGSDDENLLGVESDDDEGGGGGGGDGDDELGPEPEVGQHWKAQKGGLHIRSEPGGREATKEGLREGEIITEEGRMLCVIIVSCCYHPQ